MILRKIRVQADLMKEQLTDARSAGDLASANAAAILAAIQDQATRMKEQVDLIERQIKVMEGHTKAAEDSALAAKRNAEVLVNSERAWIVVDKVYPPKLAVTLYGLAGVGSNSFIFDLKNVGRTVGRLGTFRTMWSVLPRSEALPEVPNFGPIEGELKNLVPVYGRVMAPGETVERLPLFIYELFDDQKIMDIRNGMSILWCYGRVKYFDFADIEHHMHFCYRYVSRIDASWTGEEQYISAGPVQYHAHT
jgi:hypothetical protein